MRKSRFTEEQIIAILSEQERGMATAEVCRRHGVSQGTFYKWKAKFGGMDVSDEVQNLRRESHDLKEVVAEQALELRLLKKSMIGDGEDIE